MTSEGKALEPVAVEVALARLMDVLAGYGRVAVALSGGVDSSLVAAAAWRALGSNAVALTAKSASVPQAELELARAMAASIGIRHVVVETHEFEKADYVRNDGTRCYHCKSELYGQVERLRGELGFEVICSGANLDDLGDYRPGLQAAAERAVKHPLIEAKFTKEMVRAGAKHWGLANWNKAASPCLSSRIAVGVEATPERTRRVELAEVYLAELGFQTIRVRHHEGELARVEVGETEIARFVDAPMRGKIAAKLKELGFKFVAVDLEGFRSGGLNVLVPAEMLRKLGD